MFQQLGQYNTYNKEFQAENARRFLRERMWNGRIHRCDVTLSEADHTAKQYDAGLRCHKESTASGTPYDEMRGLAKQQEGS